MKLSDYIKRLQAIEARGHGDTTVVIIEEDGTRPVTVPRYEKHVCWDGDAPFVTVTGPAVVLNL